nr:phage holin family protein [Actinomycetales bacterium]
MTPPNEPTQDTSPPNAPNPQDPRTIGQLVSAISGQFSGLIRGELDLAQANLKEKVAKLGAGGVMFAIAGVLALYMLGMLLAAAAWGLASVMPIWAGFLIVAGVLLLFIVILGLIGMRAMKKSKEYEVAPKEGIKKSVDAAKMGFKK